MASRYKTTAQKLLGYADQQHLPQPAAQQLLEKIGRVVTMCLKLARAPYVGAEAELKKVLCLVVGKSYRVRPDLASFCLHLSFVSAN